MCTMSSHLFEVLLVLASLKYHYGQAVNVSCATGTTTFTCQNGNMVSCDYLSDGVNDCGDNSDEGVDYQCPAASHDVFKCTTVQACVALSFTLDNSKDCTDGSDETKLLNDPCAGVPTGFDCFEYIPLSQCSASGVCECISNAVPGYRNTTCVEQTATTTTTTTDKPVLTTSSTETTDSNGLSTTASSEGNTESASTSSSCNSWVGALVGAMIGTLLPVTVMLVCCCWCKCCPLYHHRCCKDKRKSSVAHTDDENVSIVVISPPPQTPAFFNTHSECSRPPPYPSSGSVTPLAPDPDEAEEQDVEQKTENMDAKEVKKKKKEKRRKKRENLINRTSKNMYS